MRRSRRHFSVSFDRLEERVVLSHAHSNPSVVVGGLNPGQFALTARQQSVLAEINQAFSSFNSDFDQARATYFASILNQSSPNPLTVTAFVNYTTQRVELLSEQLVSSFLQSSLSASRRQGEPNTLKQLISSKIIGPQGKAPEGSLAKSLDENIPMPGISAPTESLYSLSQNIAIQTAEASMINGLSILRSGYFASTATKVKK
jgi:hypothetical protein